MILSCINTSCCIQKKKTTQKSVNKGNKGVDEVGCTKEKGGAKQPPATAKENAKKASGSRIKVCA